MNEAIRITPIRLIGAEGEPLGIVPTAQALEMAREAGMDLVEVADKERPPVCKIMDFGKFKYAQSKKSHQKTHQQKLKEIRVRPKTGDHDIQTKINQAREFLDHNDKVQVNVLFRGREMQHIEEGHRVMNQVLEALQNDCKIEMPAKMEGKRMVALLAPKPGPGEKGGGSNQGTPKPKAAPKPKPPAPPPGANTAPGAAPAPAGGNAAAAPTPAPAVSAGAAPPPKPPAPAAAPASAAPPQGPAPKPAGPAPAPKPQAPKPQAPKG
jgi:translation initiation factor IF-3